VANEIEEEDCAMNALRQDQSSQETTRVRRIGFLVYPECEILDVCGPFDAFHWADHWLRRFGKTSERSVSTILRQPVLEFKLGFLRG
jgi:transcriptional regulator GlxA family with amidase domain